ncbi:MAG: hypothetical protein EA358_10015 [Flavobacteriales bacterium]|nr:MAG: hypothetical protein EA358_10015 [Flavobacteriales bacterium]
MKKIMMFSVAITMLMACSKDDDNNSGGGSRADVILVADLAADQGTTFFSLRNNAIIPAEDSAGLDSDIAFNATNIYLNGGVSGGGEAAGQVRSGIFDEVLAAPASGYLQDNEEAPALSATRGNAWYIYNDGNSMPPFAVLMIPGRVVHLKTADGGFAKLELLSYYKGNPDTGSPDFANLQTRPASRYFTFRYALADSEGKY